MTEEIGDRTEGHGDQLTRYNNSGSEIDKGLWVVPSGDNDVVKSDVATGNGDLVGVVSDPVEDGDYKNVHVRGAVWARVGSAVVAGDELAAPDSGGTTGSETAGVADAGGSSGHFALTDARDDGNGNYYAKVLLR